MPLELDRGEDIDTLCRGCREEEDTLDPNGAVGWVNLPNGLRGFYCEHHLSALTRFDAASEELHEHPVARRCEGCQKLTLMDDIRERHRCPDCLSG